MTDTATQVHGQQSPAAKHTSGPWHAMGYKQSHAFVVTTTPGEVRGDIANVLAGLGASTDAEVAANARLIAASPDYYDAAHCILHAIEGDAAPVDPLAALEEMALAGKHVTLDAGLVLDLLKAHAKATGGAA